LQVIHRVIATFLIKQSGLKPRQANTGAVTLIQRGGRAEALDELNALLSARVRLSGG